MSDLERAQHMVAEWNEMPLSRVEEMPLEYFRLVCEVMFQEVSQDVERRRMLRVTGQETMPWQS